MFMLDVSHFQGEINWAQIKADGVPGVLAKVNQGDDPGLVDGRWTANRHNALSMGIPIGGYHWAMPERNALSSQMLFSRTLDQVPGMLPPFLDFEYNGNGNTSKPLNPGGKNPLQLHAWIHDFLADYGKPMGVYTGDWFWRPAVEPSAAADTNIGSRPLWISRYATDIGRIPRPWHAAALWQFTETGRITGIDGNVDEDKLIGDTIAQLLGYATTGVWPPVAGGGDDVTPAQMQEIKGWIDHAVDEIRTETAEGNSIANVMHHLNDLQADVNQIKTTLNAS